MAVLVSRMSDTPVTGFQAGDSVAVGENIGTIRSVDGDAAEVQVREGRRLRLKRISLEDLLPVGIDEPVGEGSGIVEGTLDGADLGSSLLDFAAVFRDGARFRAPSGGEVVISVQHVGEIEIRTRPTVCDPVEVEEAQALDISGLRGTAGVYFASHGGENVAALLSFSDEEPDRWSAVPFTEGGAGNLPAHYCSSSGGLLSFADFQRVTKAGTATELRARAKGRSKPFTFTDGEEVVACGFPARSGAGAYPCYAGFRGEEPVCAVVDFDTLYQNDFGLLSFSDIGRFHEGTLRHPLFEQYGMEVTFESFETRVVVEVHDSMGRADRPFDAPHFRRSGERAPQLQRGRTTFETLDPTGTRSTYEFYIARDVVAEAELSFGVRGGRVAYQPVDPAPVETT